MDVDPACAVAHGDAPTPLTRRALVAVFASPLAGYLRHFGADLGWSVGLYDPSTENRSDAGDSGGSTSGVDLSTIDADTDVVVTDHHRPELGPVLRDVLGTPARWVGVIGSPRHTGPHITALESLGVPPDQIARVHRPIGLNIGARTPAEIALAILAGLIAERAGRPGGFTF